MRDRKNSLEERLKAHPQLRKRIESLLKIVEDESDDVETADEAEQRLIDELRRMGNEALHDWAIRKEMKKVKSFRKSSDGAKGHGKKNYAGIRHSEKS